MCLSEEQKKYLESLCSKASLDELIKLKKGNIEGIKDFKTKLIDPELIIEHEDMKEILKKWINIKNK